MRVTVELDINNCDDCPFLVYNHTEDVCVLADEEIEYPFAFNTIPANCPLKQNDKIKYSTIKVIK